MENVVIRIAFLAAATGALLLNSASADEMANKGKARKRVVAMERVSEQVEVWSPCWYTRLAFYDITDPYWIRPMCLKGTRTVYAR